MKNGQAAQHNNTTTVSPCCWADIKRKGCVSVLSLSWRAKLWGLPIKPQGRTNNTKAMTTNSATKVSFEKANDTPAISTVPIAMHKALMTGSDNNQMLVKKHYSINGWHVLQKCHIQSQKDGKR